MGAFSPAPRSCLDEPREPSVRRKRSIGPAGRLELSDWAYVLVGGRIARSAAAADVLADPAMGEVFLGRSVEA
jgi:hypothetical protein